MKFGVMLPHFLHHASRESILHIAAEAERLGFDSVWTTDHLAIVDELQPRFGTHVLESLTTMAFVSGVTSRVKIGISALVVPYRNPLIAAKMLTSIDVLSQGRLIVGAVSGWCELEFEALGVAHADRGRLTDEGLELLVALWRSEGRPVMVRGQSVVFEPSPLQRPRPPLWVGGNSARGLRRALAYGDSWHLAPPSLNDVTWARSLLDEALERHDRPPDSLTLSIRLPLLVTEPGEAVKAEAGHHPRAELRQQRFSGETLDEVNLIGPPDRIIERLAGYAERGVDYVVFDLFYSLPQLVKQPVSAMVDTMEAFVETIQPELR